MEVFGVLGFGESWYDECGRGLCWGGSRVFVVGV